MSLHPFRTVNDVDLDADASLHNRRSDKAILISQTKGDFCVLGNNVDVEFYEFYGKFLIDLR
jgi:hypothetical protein